MSPISKRRVILLDYVECPSPPITRPIIEGEDRNTNESFAQDDLININKQRLQEERGAYLYFYSQLYTNKTFWCGITVQGYPFPYFPDTVDDLYISFRREEEYNTEKDCICSVVVIRGRKTERCKSTQIVHRKVVLVSCGVFYLLGGVLVVKQPRGVDECCSRVLFKRILIFISLYKFIKRCAH